MCFSLWESLQQILSLHSPATDENGIRTLVFSQRVCEVEAVETFYKIQKCENASSKDDVVYHGKLFAEMATTAHVYWNKSLEKNKVCIMVCTNAVGTRVSSERVEAVFHFGESGNLAEYVQEIGRDERGNGTMYCVLVFCVAFAKQSE